MSAQAPLSDVKLVYFASDGWQQCQAAPEGQQASYAAVLALCARVCAPGDVQVRILQPLPVVYLTSSLQRADLRSRGSAVSVHLLSRVSP